MFPHEILEKNENLEIREFTPPHIMCGKRFGHLETLYETVIKLTRKEYCTQLKRSFGMPSFQNNPFVVYHDSKCGKS